MATYDSLLPTPNSSDQYNANLKDNHDLKKGYLRGIIATSLQEASPASPFPKLDEERERKITATSGLKCFELYNLQNRNGSSLKTCVALLLGTKAWFSNKCVLTWKAKGTKFNRLLFLLSPLVRPTEGTGFGLLATPNTMDNMEPKTEKAIVRESTVTRKGRTKFANLKEQIAYGVMLPTPDSNMGARGAAKEWKGKRPSGAIQQKKLNDLNVMAGTKTGLKLQPAFVEWMQGFPLGWTDVEKSKIPETKNLIFHIP